jgi:hypothetical protein
MLNNLTRYQSALFFCHPRRRLDIWWAARSACSAPLTSPSCFWKTKRVLPRRRGLRRRTICHVYIEKIRWAACVDFAKCGKMRLVFSCLFCSFWVIFCWIAAT